MIQKLPTGNFSFLDNDHPLFSSLEAIHTIDDSKYGYIFEIDLDYPLHLHDLHVDLPFAAEHISNRLIPNLNDKKNYKILYKHLQLCLQHGLLLKKVHAIIRYEHSEWLRPFIEMNTELRKISTNPSERDHMKLMNNSIFGKSMENVLGRSNYKIFGEKDIKKMIKCVDSPGFVSEFIINESLVLLEMKKKAITFNKPVYTGFVILELSKTWFYNLIYNVIKPKFKDCILSYIDTDSCVFETSVDPYKTMLDNPQHFDLSVYPPEFFGYSTHNKGVLGTFKDEFAKAKDGKMDLITKFTALRAKCYSVVSLGAAMKKCKGVKKKELAGFTHEDFMKTHNDVGMDVTQQTFRSKNHRMYTVESKMVGILSNKDSKRSTAVEHLTTPLGYKRNSDN